MIRFLTAVSAATVVFFGVVDRSAEAATKTLWYLGGLAEVSNYEASDRPAFQTGWMKFYLDEIHDTSFKNSEFDCSPWGCTQNGIDIGWESVYSGFAKQDDSAWEQTHRLKFDQAGKLTNWEIYRHYYIWPGPDAGTVFNVINGADNFERAGFGKWGFYVEDLAHGWLQQLGYQHGTKAYNDLFCGSWAGHSCKSGRVEPSEAWATLLYSPDSGRWFDDRNTYDAALLAQEELARDYVPASYYDIPPAPVPVPATLFLLAGAVGVLGCFARKQSKQA